MKGIGRKINAMGLVTKYLQIAALTKETISKIRCKDRVNTAGQPDRLMRVNLPIILNMVLECG